MTREEAERLVSQWLDENNDGGQWDVGGYHIDGNKLAADLLLTADREAHARGRREALEEAAQECDARSYTHQRQFNEARGTADGDRAYVRIGEALNCRDAIRALGQKAAP